MKCANYMDFEAIREAVKKHEEQWGPRDPKDRIPYDLSESNLTRVCIVCDFGGTGSPVLDGAARVMSENLPGSVSIVGVQEMVKKLTGEPMKRVCFKELGSG